MDLYANFQPPEGSPQVPHKKFTASQNIKTKYKTALTAIKIQGLLTTTTKIPIEHQGMQEEQGTTTSLAYF